ncbi:ABC transporter ATP-binding protein [Calidifontibacillus erzurumensis]|uniref:ABC transporter ATP-binding protein n=1 Tax=Calidifontibacillus erzurumensis TaxID=2741433 RepID=UPI0035B55E32
MKSPIVSMTNVSKIYGNKEVVKNINLQIERGEIFALLGHNGAGKSTLIKLFTGLIEKSAGEIKINGIEITPFQKKAKQLFSYLPEIMSLYPHLTAKETVHFFAELQNLPKKNEDEVLEIVGLSEYKHQKVGNFSKGMTQRMGFAIALLPKSPLLILDEPTSGLDPFWAIQFKKVIKHLNEEGTTIIFASHILSEVEDLADRVGIMSDGELVALGSIPELKKNAKDEVKIKVLFYKPISFSEFKSKLPNSIETQKDTYIISCKYDDKINVLKALQTFGNIKDIEIKEITLEDIYQEILNKRYELLDEEGENNL